MAAFQAERFGCATNVPMILVELLQDVITLIGRARLMQRRVLWRLARAFAIYQWWQMLAVEPRDSRIHNHQPLDNVSQLAYVTRPGIAHQRGDRVICNLARASAVS